MFGFTYYRLIFLCLVAINISFAYTPPSATVEPLYPKGLRLSVPHEQGITLVAYHVKFNDDFYSLEAGVISIDIIKPRKGRWVYEDHTTELKEGDIIYFWVHVVYQGLGYNLLNQEHRVTEFFNYDGTPVSANKNGNCDKPSPSKLLDKSGNLENVCSGQLIFEDTFNSLNASTWTVLEQFSDTPDFEFVVYINDQDNVKIQNQQLTITPTFLERKHNPDFVRRGLLELERCTSTAGSKQCKQQAFGSNILPPVASGRLNTKNSFAFQYGRIEIRAKLPEGDWIYPLISLEVANENKQEGWTQPVIRIASASGNPNLRSVQGTDLSGHVLRAGGLKSVQISQGQTSYPSRAELMQKNSGSQWSDDFHVYEIEWRDDRILAKVDKTIFDEQRIGNEFNQPFYLTLGLAVGGRGEFPDSCKSNDYEKPWKNTGSKAILQFYEARDNWGQTWNREKTDLKIDYVKVWAL